MPDFDEDLAAILLGALDMVPAMEIRPAFEADHIAPAVGPVGLDPLGNHGGLCLPELIRIRKNAMLAKEVGRNAGVGPYRRANILDVTVCTYPFILPFFIPTILAASMTAGVEGLPRISPWDAGLHNVHSWALLIVLLASIAVGRREREAPAIQGS